MNGINKKERRLHIWCENVVNNTASKTRVHKFAIIKNNFIFFWNKQKRIEEINSGITIPANPIPHDNIQYETLSHKNHGPVSSEARPLPRIIFLYGKHQTTFLQSLESLGWEGVVQMKERKLKSELHIAASLAHHDGLHFSFSIE